MKKLEDTYWEIKRISPREPELEPLESVKLIEQYRRYMRPVTVKVVLLAESHVYTTDEDRQIIIPSIPALPGYPDQYAKFVYCLGYGEKMLTNVENHPRRDGTPQFWQILFSCNNKISSLQDFAPILKTTPYQERLRNKINLLNDLKEKGVWLVDSSIVALYNHGVKPQNMNEIIDVSWKGYTKSLVLESSPKHVICIGKGVYGIVKKDLPPDTYEINQPNARITSDERLADFQKLSRTCASTIGF
ncbi:MAG: hypothetical protein RI826_08310 [Chlorobium phaeovibrioides]|nr:hypothetical protein [Chlorobium phaeovibrioides]